MASMIQDAPAADHVTNGDPQLENICNWVRDTLGGTVTKITRQRRWRPVWRVARGTRSARVRREPPRE